MKPEKIPFPNGSGYVCIQPERIAYCKADGSATKIHLQDGKNHHVPLNLKKVQIRINSPNLIRCHNSYLVNLLFINEIHGAFEKLELLTKAKIPVSRRKRAEVRRIILHTEQ